MNTNLSLQSAQVFVRNELDEHLDNLKLIYDLTPQIYDLSNLILKVLNKGNKLLICGNGGSAADAQHFSSELMGRYEKDRTSLPAISLSTDTSALTAIGNDFGFNEIFSRQIEGIGQSGDILIVISTSGNSKNLINAIETAKKKNIQCAALLGKKGGLIYKISDIEITVPSDRTCRIQEMHGLIIHIICGLIEQNY
mgnify:CR=1 FL=1|tara:strand:- start:3654 stop:4241 length:588 start_codon:yes stop_codon:yes gene_type:complete